MRADRAVRHSKALTGWDFGTTAGNSNPRRAQAQTKIVASPRLNLSVHKMLDTADRIPRIFHGPLDTFPAPNYLISWIPTPDFFQ